MPAMSNAQSSWIRWALAEGGTALGWGGVITAELVNGLNITAHQFFQSVIYVSSGACPQTVWASVGFDLSVLGNTREIQLTAEFTPGNRCGVYGSHPSRNLMKCKNFLRKACLYFREKLLLLQGVLFWVITSINVTVTYIQGELVYNIQTSKYKKNHL